VRLSFPSLKGRAQNVPIHIFHSMGDSTVYVDQSQTPDIEGRFVSLGSYTFDADGDSYVIVSNEGTKGYVCVDALQFIPEGSSDQVAETPKPNQKTPDSNKAIAKLQAEIQRMEEELAVLKKNRESLPVVMSVRKRMKSQILKSGFAAT